MIYKIFSIIILTVFLASGCNNIALFDELAENRIKVIIKGTYESNNPRPWSGTYPFDDDALTSSVSIDDLPVNTSLEENPTEFMLDIAELKIANSTGQHVQNFANYRKTYRMGLQDDVPFFNGTGVLYENDDVRPDFRWDKIYMYIRKMIFNNARYFRFINDSASDADFNGLGVWEDRGYFPEYFHEEIVNGFDFNRYQLLSYYDTLRVETAGSNRIFPLVIPIMDGLVFDNDENETVLEIRIVIKNFIKKYEYDFSDGDGYKNVVHFFGLSDWLRDIKADESAFGGNILAVARAYVPGKTSTISGTATAGRYVIAFSSDYFNTDFEVSSTDRTRPGCDHPFSADSPVPGDFESTLDYFLKLQKYNEEYINIANTCWLDDDLVYEPEYSTKWINYNEKLNSYMIPPLATYSSSGTYELTNVPVGKTYHIYMSNDAPDPAKGELPSSFTECTSGIINKSPIFISGDVSGLDCN